MGGFFDEYRGRDCRNWNDNTQARSGGEYADRVVRVAPSRKNEGGMNLKYAGTRVIESVAKKGRGKAADQNHCAIFRSAESRGHRIPDHRKPNGWGRLVRSALGKAGCILVFPHQKIASLKGALGSSIPHTKSYAQPVDAERACRRRRATVRL